MDEQLLRRILSCSKLPSVSAVALRVIELTNDPNVQMRKLAETIQHDQGLATKILRTVNSPFYGLIKKCSSIHQAQLMLGLNGVKTLALGFSLISSIEEDDEFGFDYRSYWRRSVYSSVGSRAVAREMNCPYAEEAFLGGLLQDIGQIALLAALGDEYVKIVREAGPSHHELGRIEVEQLEIHHAEVGAMLAERWRLPDPLVAPIRFHEKPSAASGERVDVCRAVALGNLAAAALSLDPPGPWVDKFRRQCLEWLRIGPQRADELLEQVGKGGAELAQLLGLATGPAADAQSILETAQERLVEIALERDRASEDASRKAQSLERDLLVDVATGVASRFQLLDLLGTAFRRSRETGAPLSLAIFDPDKLKRINQDHGWEIGNAVLVTVARRLQERFSPQRAVVGRWGGDEFAVVFENVDRAAASAAVQEFVAEVAAKPLEPEHEDMPAGVLAVSVSAGVATLDAGSAEVFSRFEQLVNGADQALHAAQAAGGAGVRVFAPCKKAAAA